MYWVPETTTNSMVLKKTRSSKCKRPKTAIMLMGFTWFKREKISNTKNSDSEETFLLPPHVSRVFWRIKMHRALVFPSLVLPDLNLEAEIFSCFAHENQRNRIKKSIYKSEVKRNRTEKII